MSFNAVEFLYLNPELQAYSNIIDVEDAITMHNNGDTAGFYTSMSNIPANFNPETFITGNMSFMNVSDLNYTIRIAMTNTGTRPRDIELKSKYISTIFKDVVYDDFDFYGFDRFIIQDPNFILTSNILGAEDQIILISNNRSYYVKVVYADSTGFSLDNNDYLFEYGATYKLWGILVTDPERIAKINYVRNYDSIISVQPGIVNSFSDEFNPSLYRLLYPDAKSLSDVNAYFDYITRKSNSIPRIQNVNEILTSVSQNSSTISQLTISSNLSIAGETVMNAAVTMCNNAYVYESLFVTKNINCSSNVNVGNNVSVTNNIVCGETVTIGSNIGISNDLIVNRFADVGCNLHVHSNLEVDHNAYVTRNMYVTGATSLASNLTVFGQTNIKNELYVNSNIYGSNDAVIYRDLYVGRNTTLSNELTIVSHASIRGNIQTNSNIYVGSNVIVSKDIITSNNVYVLGDEVIRGRLTVSNDVLFGCNLSISEELYTRKSAVFSSNVTVSNDISILGTSRMYGGVNIYNSILGSSNLTIGSNAYISGTLQVLSNLDVTNNAVLRSNLNVLSSIVASSNITASNNLYVLNNATVTSNTTLQQNLFVRNQTIVNSNITTSNDLFVLGNGSIYKDFLVYSNVSISNNAAIAIDATIGRNLQVRSNASVFGTVTICNDIYGASNVVFGRNLQVGNNTSIFGTLTACNDTILYSNLTVGRDVVIGSNVTISNHQWVIGNIVGNSNATFSNNLQVIRNTSLGGTLGVNGIATFERDVQIKGTFSAASNLFVGSNDIYAVNPTTFQSNVTFCNQVVLASNVNMQRDLTLSNNLYVGKTATFNDTVTISSNVTTSNNLLVLQSAIVNSNITACNNLEVVGTSRMRNSLLLTGGAYLDKCEVTSNIVVNNNAVVYGSLSVNGNLYNPRIGLGYMGTYLTSNNGPNIIQAQNYNDNSDRRIKQDIADITGSLDKLNKIQIKQFRYNYGIPEMDAKITYGCIAQEIQEVDPTATYSTIGWIPNIMKPAEVINNQIVFHEACTLTLGTTYKVLTKANTNVQPTIKIRSQLNATTYILEERIPEGSYTVYGELIDTLMNVDYKQLFVLTMGAVRELSDKVRDLEHKLDLSLRLSNSNIN